MNLHMEGDNPFQIYLGTVCTVTEASLILGSPCTKTLYEHSQPMGLLLKHSPKVSGET